MFLVHIATVEPASEIMAILAFWVVASKVDVIDVFVAHGARYQSKILSAKIVFVLESSA